MKSKINVYPDGIVKFYKADSKSSSFGARMNVSGIDDMEMLVKLPYAEASRRTQDLEFAEQSGFSLSLKLRVPMRPEVNNKIKAVIHGYLYDVKYVDSDRSKKEMYVYLEGVKKINAGSS